MRRAGGPRREVSERARLVGGEKSFEGWALNVSRGGVRCILDTTEAKNPVELGEEYDVTVGEDSGAPLTRRGRIVWLQEEPDGVVVGVEFVNLSGLHKSVEQAEPIEPVEPAPEREPSES